MRIVAITSRFPFPLDKGDKLRAYHQLFQLSKENEIHLIAISDKKVEDYQIEQVKTFCKSVYVFKLKKWKIAINLFIGLFSNKPFQVKYFYQRSIHKKVKALIQTIQPDHIYCQLIRCVSYVQDEHQYKKTLDYMDAFSKGMERRIKNAGIKKPLFKIEAFRLIRFENLAFEFFDNHCIISDQDRSLIFHEKKQ
ncbi:MAG: glycosyltransferase, partial [Crocinitomicaceae bacterium]|nr:glycosyltransferase [Crocinitomicaceae bacterium]